ncbi:amino acid permease [Seongchinamella sediminis]|uniref:Amino acid permease n=2 Tax=Seongchinamella sediminis TaxID=2283635 RepID=A0A3L7DUY3_9GAMM|nr:amino acid permease [Seongchinamella sediminis]
MGVRDMTLFTVSAILLLDTLAASASIGVSSISWWLIMGVIFFIPYGLISAELGTTYPEQGGIYSWIRHAFGSRWGTRATWCYWLNTALWNASIFILFSGVFAQMFFPDLAFSTQITMAIGITWLVVIITCLSLRIGKWIPNAGATLKTLTFAAIVVGGVVYALQPGIQLANDFSLQAFVPEWGSSTQYVSTIIYGMLGFELMSSASEEMKNPQRDIPRSILSSGLIIFLSYILGTFAILAVIPAGDINLVEGLVDTLRLLFGESQLGQLAAMTLGVFALFTFFSNGTTWAIGANRAAAESAADGELPRLFALESPHNGSPVGATLLMGLVCTGVLLAYGAVAGSNEDLFWSLFAASAVLFILPYIAVVAAFYRARQIDGERSRPFKVAGGDSAALGMSGLCMFLLAITALLFMYVPGSGFDWPVVIGSVTCILLGEVAMRYAEHERRRG